MVLLRPVGCIGPEARAGVPRADQVRCPGTDIYVGLSDIPGADQPMRPVDANLGLVPEHRNGQVDRLERLGAAPSFILACTMRSRKRHTVVVSGTVPSTPKPREPLERKAILDLELRRFADSEWSACSTRIWNMRTWSDGGRGLLPRTLRLRAAITGPLKHRESKDTGGKSTTPVNRSIGSPASLKAS